MDISLFALGQAPNVHKVLIVGTVDMIGILVGIGTRADAVGASITSLLALGETGTCLNASVQGNGAIVLAQHVIFARKNTGTFIIVTMTNAFGPYLVVGTEIGIGAQKADQVQKFHYKFWLDFIKRSIFELCLE